MNRQIISLLSIFVFISCASKRPEDKLYGKCQIPMYGCYQILIKQDNTFEQYIFSDVGGENIVKGKWEILKGDTIKLNSFSQPADDEFLELELTSPIYLRDELIIFKNNKITFLEKNNRKKFRLKRTQLKNKIWK